jgi:Double-GTPase 2
MAGEIMSSLIDLLVFGVYGIGLAGFCIIVCLFTRPEMITPQQYQQERVAARPTQPGQFDPDVAWPLYPFRQARTDLLRVGAETGRLYRRLWRWPVDAFFRGWHGSRFLWWFFFPIPLTVLYFLVATGFAALVTVALFVLVTAVCVGGTLAVLAPAVGTLRWAESYRRRRLRTDASCSQCHHVMPWPAYQCSGCRDVHHDLRPGRLGLFWRRCQCGTRLPTMPLRAAWRLRASCPRCRATLPTGSGAVRDIRIPVLGDPSAGKTRFLYAALHSLLRVADRHDISHGYPDPTSKDRADEALALIRSGQDTPKTSATLPPPLNIRLGVEHRQTLVHMFDAAGEVLRNPEMHDTLGFLDLGQGLVYVLDPFSIGSIRDRLTGHASESIRQAEMAAGDPEAAFNETVTRLRDSGVKASRQRLAVVISKVDLLQSAGLEVPEESGAIEDWLTQAGVHNLVMAARRDFADVRYFAVASQAFPDGRRPDDPGIPLRWLLRAHGVRLPPDLPRISAARSPGDQPESDPRRGSGAPDEAARTA